MALWHREILQYQLKDACVYWFVIPGAVLGSGWLLDKLLGWTAFRPGPFPLAAGIALILLGSSIINAVIRDFARLGHGTANPRRPPKVLVRKGTYALCRHPMFLGYDLAALGVVLLSRSPATLWLIFPGFLVGQILFLRKEERYLVRRFGGPFADYQKQVPFLLPTCISRRRS